MLPRWFAYDPKRMDSLMTGKAEPETKAEVQIVGYREALDLIHGQCPDLAISPETIKRLHKTAIHQTGSYPEDERQPTHDRERGAALHRFTPSSSEVDALSALCDRYEQDIIEGEYAPVLLAIKFVVDFMRIFPSLAGRGRLSRLLMTLLLLRSGLDAVKFGSIESRIALDSRSYREAISASAAGRPVHKNDYQPFMTFMLRTSTAPCRILQSA